MNKLEYIFRKSRITSRFFPHSCLFGVMLFILSACNTHDVYTFEYAEPESKAYSSEKLDVLRKHLEASGSSSMMILVDGKVVFEWGDTKKKHLIHSMRKAMLNSLYGIAVKKGQIDTSMTLRELGINDIEPALTENEMDAQIADLLRSRSGVYHNAAALSQGMLDRMPERDSHKPGEHYYYNNWDFNTLGAILEQQTGESIYELFYKEIALPTGMSDFRGRYTSIDAEAESFKRPKTDGYYRYENSKSRYPAYHFRMSARDLAIYGLLYLNRGSWNGEQIIPAEWIDACTRAYSKYDPEHGTAYGMLWYVRIPDENTIRNSFYHTGLGIHMLGVYPDLNMVFVHRVDTESNFEYEKADFYKMLGLLFDSRE